jgi:hypothetical protein
VVLVVGGRRWRPSTGGGRHEAFVSDAHRGGTDNAGDEACDEAAQDRRVSRVLIGPSVP